MAETSVLAELMFEVVPHWNGKLEKYLKNAGESQRANSGVIITPSGIPAPKVVELDAGSSTRRIIPGTVTTPGVGGVPMPPPSPITNPSDKPDDSQPKKNLVSPLGQCHLSAKPDPKARFSSLTSPVVMYDGESQQMLCDMWTALNNKRGGLRKEMMAVKRRQQLASIPPPPSRIQPEIAMDSDDEDGSDKDDEDVEHSAELLRLRLKMEREKMKRMVRRGPPGGVGPAPAPDMGPPPPSMAMGGLQFKRARMMGGTAGPSPAQPAPSNTSTNDDKVEKLLEGIDENLDKACKVIETVAFIWLKGEAYDGHLKFIVGRLNDIVDKIEKSGLVPPKKKEEEKKDVIVTVMAPPAPSFSSSLQQPQKILPSPRLEVSKKKSDLTMRDAPSLKMVTQPLPLSPPTPEQSPIEATLERKKSTGSNTSEDTVGPSMESANPPLVLISTTSTGTAAHMGDAGKLVLTTENNSNPLKLKHEVLEVNVHGAGQADDDDEGIVC